MYIAWINCNNCGRINVEEDANIVIWYAIDSEKQLCEITCPKCSSVTSSNIHDALVDHLKEYAQNKQLNDKFEPLTEEMIDNWNLEQELDELFA